MSATPPPEATPSAATPSAATPSATTPSATTPTAAPADVTLDRAVVDDLVARLVEHCELMCETGHEGPIADAVAGHHAARGDVVERIANSLVIRPSGMPDPTTTPPDARRPLVVLAGHLDVVAPTDDDREVTATTSAGVDVVVGRGTSDMKAGNVVAMRAFERVADGDLTSAADVVLVLYSGEEGPAAGNELATVIDRVAWLAAADLVVILEPTDGRVELGCLGGLHATLTVHGRQAHSARPWHGRNALTAAGTLLTAFDSFDPIEVEVGGVVYHDVWSVTQLDTPNGRNVIPGQVDINLNFRFSPSRDIAAAEQELRDVVAGMADVLDLEIDVVVTDRALPASPGSERPLTRQFLDIVSAEVAAKQAWTDVARFAALDVAALNFGPGRTDQAHQRGEFVEVWRLAACSAQLEDFLTRLTPTSQRG